MRLNTIDIIILLLLGTLTIIRSFWGLTKDINLDITKSNAVIGEVSQAGIKKIKEQTLKLDKYKTVFAILLDNSKENFAVDRGISICKQLDTQIKIGDSIKIYYRPGSGDFNTHVFQIERNNIVLIGYKDYSRKELGMIISGFIFGVLVTGGTLFWMVRQRKNQNN